MLICKNIDFLAIRNSWLGRLMILTTLIYIKVLWEGCDFLLLVLVDWWHFFFFILYLSVCDQQIYRRTNSVNSHLRLVLAKVY